MKKNYNPNNITSETHQEGMQSIIGLYEMLAQAQPDLKNDQYTPLESVSSNVSKSSRPDE